MARVVHDGVGWPSGYWYEGVLWGLMYGRVVGDEVGRLLKGNRPMEDDNT